MKILRALATALRYFFSTVRKNLLIIVSLAALLLSIPHINLIDYPQSTITSKFLVFVYFCVSLFALSTFWVLKSRLTSFSLSPIDITLAVLLVYIVINRYYFQTDYGFSIRFIELLGLSFLYVIFRTLTLKAFYGLLLAIVISGIIQAVYGNLQLLGYYPSNHSGFKLTGSFFNPGPYAGFLVAVFSIALGLYLFREKVVNHLLKNANTKNSFILSITTKFLYEYIPLVGIVSIVLVIPASQSRASWLAIIGVSILLFELRYLIVIKFLKKLTKVKKVILITTSILILALGLFGIYHFKKGSSDGRLFIWKNATEIIKDNPVFGVGFDRFKAHYMNYQADYFKNNGATKEALIADNSNYAFNEFIQFVTEQGVIGGLVLLWILYLILKTSLRKENREIGVIIKVSVLSIGIFAFFSYPMQILPIKLILVFLVSGLAVLDQNKIKLLQNLKIISPLKITLKVAAICVVLGVAGFSFNHLYKLENSFKNWQFALESYQYSDYETALKEYEIAYPILKNNGDFLMNYGKALSIYKQDEKAIQILEEAKNHLNNTIIATALGDSYKNLKEYNKAEIAYQQAANMIPIRFYPLYLLAKLYEESGQKEKARVMAEIILKKEIKVPSTAIKEIKQEMNNLKTKH